MAIVYDDRHTGTKADGLASGPSAAVWGTSVLAPLRAVALSQTNMTSLTTTIGIIIERVGDTYYVEGEVFGSFDEAVEGLRQGFILAELGDG